MGFRNCAVAHMVTAKPLISVIITSFNYRQYIMAAIDSARSQTYPNVEIVVVDNRSSDGTVPALRERYKDEPRVKIFENDENIGELRNSNRGYEHSSGEFVMWLSADDWMFPKHLERLQAVLEREPEIDLVYSGAYFADEAGRVFTTRLLGGQFPIDYVDVRDELVEMFTTTCPLCYPTALFRRSVFVDCGLADPAGPVAADWEMQIRIALAGKRFAYLAEPSTVIRLHPSQQTGEQYHASGKNVLDFLAILEMYIDHPGMVRLRGRERGIATLLDQISGASKAVGGHDPFTPEQQAQIQAMKMRLLRKAEAFEPARAREQRVSVLIPASGPPQVLARAIRSVEEQSFENWEIVIVDHGQIPLENWLRSLPLWERISYVRFPHALLPGTARNFAMRIARGEFLAYLDEDNTFAPEHLESLVAKIEQSGAQIAAASSRLVIEQADQRFIDMTRLGEADIFRNSADAAGVAYSLPLNALLYYRGLQDRVGRFNETTPLLDDFEYLLRLEKAEPIAFSPAVTLEVHARIGFTGGIGSHFAQYLPVLDAIYAAYPVTDRFAGDRRASHRAAVSRAIEGASAAAGSVQGIATVYAALAGTSVMPIAAGA